MANPIEQLANKLEVARDESRKLKELMNALKRKYQNEVLQLEQQMKMAECTKCKEHKQNGISTPEKLDVDNKNNSSDRISFPSIGIIKTQFPSKRAVPRQPYFGPRIEGCLEISKEAFNNPEHSLDGLAEYSHLWILYHFHRNDSHPKAKVAPPRLNGERVGVFSTRSPHRPAPIGLSLVEIKKIEGPTIYFYGTDMVDGTPVLDIKPYIPMYDSPMTDNSFSLEKNHSTENDNSDVREEPDGEEGYFEATNGAKPSTSNGTLSNSKTASVKIPSWVLSTTQFNVDFSQEAEQQLIEFNVKKHVIIDVLRGDPRSVYLKTRHNSELFTFNINDIRVICKFNDETSRVQVMELNNGTEIANKVNN